MVEFCLQNYYLLSVYIDDLSDKFVKGKVRCSIDNLYMNHVIYADDICLMAPSPAALQELINICKILAFKMIYLSIHPNHIVWYLSLNHISYVHYYIWIVKYRNMLIMLNI